MTPVITGSIHAEKNRYPKPLPTPFTAQEMATIELFLDILGLKATDEEKSILLEMVKTESTLRKNALSEENFLMMYQGVTEAQK